MLCNIHFANCLCKIKQIKRIINQNQMNFFIAYRICNGIDKFCAKKIQQIKIPML